MQDTDTPTHNHLSIAPTQLSDLSLITYLHPLNTHTHTRTLTASTKTYSLDLNVNFGADLRVGVFR